MLKDKHAINTLWHLQLAFDAESEHIFYPSEKSVYCINYSSIYERERKERFFQALFEGEREKKCAEKMNELSAVVEYLKTDLAPVCPLVLSDDVYYVSSNTSDYTLHFLSKDFKHCSGRPSRRISGAFSPRIYPVPDGKGRIYFVSTKGKINFLYEGNQWHLMQDTEETYSAPTLGLKGEMYFSSTQGTLYCIDPLSRPGQRGRGPLGKRNKANKGRTKSHNHI